VARKKKFGQARTSSRNSGDCESFLLCSTKQSDEFRLVCAFARRDKKGE